MWVEEHNGIRFYTRSLNTPVLRMHDENVQYNPYLWPNRLNFCILKKSGVEKHEGDIRY